MKHLEELKDTISRELEKYAKSGELTINSLDKIHKLTDTLKNIDKIEMLEEDGGYSEASRWMGDGRMYGTSYRGGSSYDGGSSYARGRTGNVKRDSMGRYSRDGAKDELMDKIDEMMENADPNEREALKECKRTLERM